MATTCPYCGGEIDETTVTCPHCSSDLRVAPPAMRIESMRINDRGAAFVFSGTSPEAVADEFERFFVSEGFALEDGTKLMGAYGTGSAKGRAFGGGFVNRRKFDMRIAQTPDGHVEAAVTSAMSGWSGSLVGVAKERKGRKSLNLALESHFAPFMRA
jgi:hypothetical protein